MEKRVSLRLASIDDVEFIVSIKSNPNLWPFEDDIETDKEKVKKTVIDRINGSWYKQYIVQLKDEKKTPIGEFHIHWYVEERKSWEIGYCIFPEYQRQGYCFEAANGMINIAFRDFGAHRVVAMCNAHNEASYHIMEKLGMTREAVFRQELPVCRTNLIHERWITMPLPMVHLGVAKNIMNTRFQLKELPQYYLGAISPDAIHMRQNSNRLDKNQTHLVPLIPSGKKWSDLDEIECFKILLDYIESNKSKANVDFLWGYCIHIFTDMLWTKYVYKDFVDNYRKDPFPIQEERWAYYNDTDILDQILYNESSWRNDVWQQLQQATGSDFLDLLSANEISLWNERTLHWYDSGESQHKNNVKYINKSDILNFISNCSESIIHSL